MLVSLSEKGKKAYLHHQQFHEQMIEAIVEELSEEEQAVLEKALVKLDRFLMLIVAYTITSSTYPLSHSRMCSFSAASTAGAVKYWLVITAPTMQP